MSKPRLGLWLVGAKGGVATTVITGLAALQQQKTPMLRRPSGEFPSA